MLVILFFVIMTIRASSSARTCNITIVETVPQYLTYDSTAYIAPPIWKVWKDLIGSAKKYIKINSFYWSLLPNDTNISDNSSLEGLEIFSMLLDKSKTVQIKINHDINNASCNGIKILKRYHNINVSLINVTRLAGNGVQHSKLIIGDGKKAFIGSANMDWRSLTQIKEIGAYLTNCDDLIRDLDAFWSAINYLSGPHSRVPKVWPSNTWPQYNLTNPLKANVNGVPMTLYTASSPILFNPPHRTHDLTAIINTVKEAKKYILISVMDFLPVLVNYKANHLNKYWPDIEDAIITAAINKGVRVKMLISLWSHSDNLNLIFLRSMAELGKKMKYKQTHLEVKLLIIPAFNEFQRNLDFSRVSHSKYMVTDSTAYIGTSNWSGNYFLGTVGVSLVAKENCGTRVCGSQSIRQSLERVFYVDWNSIYAHKL